MNFEVTELIEVSCDSAIANWSGRCIKGCAPSAGYGPGRSPIKITVVLIRSISLGFSQDYEAELVLLSGYKVVF